MENSNKLMINYPEIALEWDSEKNEKIGLKLEDVASHSDKKAYWICKNGHSYYSKIDGRTRMKAGCPYCAHKVPIKGVNDLSTLYPELMKEWDKENKYSPDYYLPNSNKKVYWICPICGKHYKRKILERTSYGYGCSTCAKYNHTSLQEQTLFYYFSKVVESENRFIILGKELDVYIPSLNMGIEYNGKYFHDTKEDKDAQKYDFLRKHGIRVIVIKNGNERSFSSDVITLKVHDKNNPKDDEFTWGIKKAFEIANLEVPDINIHRDLIDIYTLYIKNHVENSLAQKYPNIAKEWNYVLNKNLKPEFFTYGSNKRVWWTCPVCFCDYDMKISSRTIGNNNCPYCAGKRIRNDNKWADSFPLLKEEWLDIKNEKTINEYSKGSDKKAWWKCKQCGYEYCSHISRRVAGAGCPVCAGKIVIKGKNDLLTLKPQICLNWDTNKNTLGPEKYTIGSNKKVWWKCKQCDYEYYATVFSQTDGRGCPNCAKKNRTTNRNLTIIKTRGSLLDNYPALMEEWDYNKNQKGPENYLGGSDKKVWWICKKCGNSFKQSPSQRTQMGQGCPECGKKKCVETKRNNRIKKEGSIKDKYPLLIQKEWDYSKNDNKPDLYTCGSDKKVWWICENCSNSFQQSPYLRTKLRIGCPKCHHKPEIE